MLAKSYSETNKYDLIKGMFKNDKLRDFALKMWMSLMPRTKRGKQLKEKKKQIIAKFSFRCRLAE